MEFWTRALGRLQEMERSQAWLARRVGRTPQAINNYVKGHRPTPKSLQREVALILDLREEQVAAA
jgi:hypothetical protein